MTEEEAKTKWCPFMTTYKIAEPHPLFEGPLLHELVVSRCIGSECMAWVERPTITRIDPKKGAIVDPDIKSGFCGMKHHA